MPKKNLVIISGAGVSAESGLATFRDSGGLWEGYKIEVVASPEGWEADKKQVLEFYNLRREQAAKAKPNTAHLGIAELESYYNIHVITQNVDDLHERAGSSKVLHLHGELNKARSEYNDELIVEIGDKAINIGDKAPDGNQLRPHIVWFGEMVPMMEEAVKIVQKADILVVVGTSLVVYPAANLINFTKPNIPKYIIDPNLPELFSYENWQHIKEKATDGIKILKKFLIENYEEGN